MIDGVSVTPLKRIPDDRGTVMHIFKATEKQFRQFGEVYCSTVYPGVIKGWHLHLRMTLNYVVIRGMIKFVMYDTRADSPTRSELQEICTGDHNYARIMVLPGVWNGFQGIGEVESFIINVTDLPYDPNELERKDPFSKEVPYSWQVKHR
jgi:dTDP-4-dehydrorhamnose 3,5-epimerase